MVVWSYDRLVGGGWWVVAGTRTTLGFALDPLRPELNGTIGDHVGGLVQLAPVLGGEGVLDVSQLELQRHVFGLRELEQLALDAGEGWLEHGEHQGGAAVLGADDLEWSEGGEESEGSGVDGGEWSGEG